MTFVRLLVLVLVLVAAPVFGAGLKDESAVKAVAEKAMGMIAKGNIKGAFETLAPYWPLPRAEIDVAITKITEQRKLFPARFGKPVGVQFVEQKVVASTVLRLVYLEKFENHTVRWLLVFYKPASEWRFNSFNFDDNINALFQHAS